MAGDTKLNGPDLAQEGLSLDELGSEIPSVGHFEGKPVVVMHTGDGPRALGGSCTHYGGPLGDGFSAAGEIRCPWHHASFDLRTGEAVGAPALDPIPVYEISVSEGRIYVTGPAEKATVEKPAPSEPPESVVIVGAGAAGAAAAEKLRAHGYEGPVTLVGEEPPVDRPNVSKDYLAGTAPEEWMPLRSRDFYSENGIELIAGKRVEAVDPTSRIVHLTDGELSYGALLIATGAEPRRLPVPGSDLAHVHYLRTLEDSKAIITALDAVERVVVVGAGFIGLEVAASLRRRDVDVTVVSPDEIPLARVIGGTLGRFVADLHGEHGVGFRLGTGVTSIDQDGVQLDDGTQLPADLIVVGIGVAPRVELAQTAGLTVDDGIIVDEQLRTSDPNIWAAGDVARYPGPDGDSVRIEHWVLAERHGQTAARNMLGHDMRFTYPPFFWSQHYDVPINVTGHLDGWDEEVVVGDPYQRDVVVSYRKAGRITAVASIYRDRDNLRAEQALATGDQHTLSSLLGR